MSSKRVRYREDQRLTSRDLNEEQSYRIKMRQRHNIAHHDWGIVNGLQLDTVSPGVIVNPGFAIDGYGRELIVPQSLTLGRAVFDKVLGIDPQMQNNQRTDYVDIWLAHCYKPSVFRKPGQASRIKEEAMLKMACGNPNLSVSLFNPPTVANKDKDFAPYDELQVDSNREWPVYLGRIRITSSETQQSYEKQPVTLAFASLVASSIHAPWGDQWLQLGDEEANDNRRFSIMLPDANGKAVDRVKLGQFGDIDMQGKVRLVPSNQNSLDGDGDLHIVGSADELNYGGGIEFKSDKPETKLAAPWQLYRTTVKRTIQEQELHVNQLRFETFSPGEDEGIPAHYEWNITRGQQKQPILSVRSDNKVIVNADLIVHGKLIEGAIPANLKDQRFRDELLARWTKGLTVAGTEVDAFYELPLYLRYGFDSDTDEHIVTVEYIGKELDREIPILAIIGEYRDVERRLVLSKKLEFEPDIGNIIVVNTSGKIRIPNFLEEAKNAATIDVRIFALGAAKNTVEKSMNIVIRS